MWVDSICIDQTSTEEQTDALLRWIKDVTILPYGEGEMAIRHKLNGMSTQFGLRIFRIGWALVDL